MLSKRIGESYDRLQFYQVLNESLLYREEAEYTEWGFCHLSVEDADAVYDEQQARQDIDYYPFTEKQLEKAGQPGFVDDTPEMRRLLHFLKANYKILPEEVDDIAFDCWEIINNTSRALDLMDYFKDRFDFPSVAMVKQLMQYLTDLNNNTRQWILKGHTPQELFSREVKAAGSISVPYSAPQIGLDNVFDIRSGQKIGRNDLCPCGSGKKYKKCCGK